MSVALRPEPYCRAAALPAPQAKMFSGEAADELRGLHTQSVDQRREMAGWLHYHGGGWHLQSQNVGEPNQVPMGDSSIRPCIHYHTHLRERTALMMPPSQADYEVLFTRIQATGISCAALVLTTEGVYRYWISHRILDQLHTLTPTVISWMESLRGVGAWVQQVHAGAMSILEYRNRLHAIGLEFEYYAY